MRVVLAVNEEVATAMTLYSRAVAVDQNCHHSYQHQASSPSSS